MALALENEGERKPYFRDTYSWKPCKIKKLKFEKSLLQITMDLKILLMRVFWKKYYEWECFCLPGIKKTLGGGTQVEICTMGCPKFRTSDQQWSPIPLGSCPEIVAKFLQGYFQNLLAIPKYHIDVRSNL